MSIRRLFGVVTGMDDDGAVVIDCRGVGHGVIVSDRDRRVLNARIGSEQLVHVKQVTKEPPEGVVLLGFLEQDDRRMFERIVAVDGCGPAVAMKLLSRWPHHELVAGVLEANVSIPGVGPKTRAKLAEAWR